MRPLRRRPALPSLTVSLAAAVLFTGDVVAQVRAGSLDPSFNGRGWVEVKPGGYSVTPNALAVQPDGKFVLTGTAGGLRDITVCRLNPDGSPDTSFNGTGIAYRPVPWPASTYSLALRSDGRILAGGQTDTPPKSIVASFLPDGRVDPSFGPGGQGWTTFAGNGAGELLLQPNGKILSSGNHVVRLLPDGVPDTGFGPSSDGKVAVPNATNCWGLALQSDGKILISNFVSPLTITRLLPDGSPDTTFGEVGTAWLKETAAPPVQPLKTVVGSDGKIVAAGAWSGGNPHVYGFAVVRLLPDGSPDPAFGDPATPGIGRIAFNGGPVIVTDLVVQDGGRFVIAGYGTNEDRHKGIALVRFTASGRADATFGTGGRVLTVLDEGTDSMSTGAALLPGGKLVVSGIRVSGVSSNLFLARFFLTPPVALDVEDSSGTPLDSPFVNFGTVTVPTGIVQVTLRNGGMQTLTNIRTAFTAASHPGEYQVTLSPGAASLPPGAALTASLSLRPTAAPGPRTATVRFTVGNSGIEPVILFLKGAKATPQQAWRMAWFGNPDNSGAGADTGDFDGDGLPNFMEYALRGNPHTPSSAPLHPAPGPSGAFAFSYIRPSGAVTEFLYEPEAALSPAGPWSSTGLTSTVLADDGTTQTVQVSTAAGEGAAPRRFLRLRVTKK